MRELESLDVLPVSSAMHVALVVASVVIGGCAGPALAVYGPKTASGVTLESMQCRDATGLYRRGSSLAGTIYNHTDRKVEVDVVADAVVAEYRGASTEKERAVYSVRTSVVVPARGRVPFAVEMRVRACTMLMYVDIKHLVATQAW